MKEKEFIQIIKQELNSKFIGDDCAYLKDLGIVVTQDSLVEDVHFSLAYMTAYELGYKSAMVNISDIAASGAKPLYLTVALSLPKDISSTFVKEFYRGLKEASKNVEIVGGDITGSDKVFVSVTAIGSDKGRRISSRRNAKIGQKIVISGNHGSSSVGLKLLQNGNLDKNNKFIKAHLMPNAQLEFSEKISKNISYDYAMMDTSDGLADALFALSEESDVKLAIDFEKIPHEKDLEQFENWQNEVLFGGEDYGIVACIDNPSADMQIIGEVKEGNGIEINCCGKIKNLTRVDVEENLYNHFK
ncbi:MAG: thiamine-phosphate kinase [Clostridiaceae bacterium]|jgi:thiamine-monophosphate kinase|nr:thiamine-phosphate kinase [Clostridiaceae bacterium]